MSPLEGVAQGGQAHRRWKMCGGWPAGPAPCSFYSAPIGPTLIPGCPRLAPASPSGYTTTLAAPSAKGRGRLIRCTVPGSTPNCSAILRTPGLPGVARASRIRFSSAGAIRRPPEPFSFALGPRQASTDSFLDHGALELGKHPETSETSPCPRASSCRAPADAGTGRCRGHATARAQQPAMPVIGFFSSADRHIESSKISHAALLLLMLEAAYADLVSPSA